MIGLLIIFSFAIYFLIGFWGLSQIYDASGTVLAILYYIIEFLISSATLGFIASVLIFGSYSGEKLPGLGFMAGYAIDCFILLIVPFLLAISIWIGFKSSKAKYVAKLIALSLPFTTAYYFILNDYLTTYFEIILHS